MIIEDLIRLGKPLIEGGMSSKDVLELISDVGDEKVKNFFRHVFVVELPPEGSEIDPVVLPMQVWGQEVKVEGKQKKVDFIPDTTLALGAPFVFPKGGNPLKPQGRYGVPVYPCWLKRKDKKTKKWVYLFGNQKDVSGFLDGRIKRTQGITINEQLREKVANVIFKEVILLAMNDDEKILGLIILVQCSVHGSLYSYSEQSSVNNIGQSKLYPNKFIIPVYEKIIDAVWAAKFEEGASVGKKEGSCSFCGYKGDVVSSYCKAWPWALPEWSCPLPHGGKETHWVEGVAICEPCYRVLTLGCNVFSGLTRLLHPIVTYEIFSVANDREGRNNSSRKKLSDLPSIRGAAYLLPLHDESLKNQDLRHDFCENTLSMLRSPVREGVFADQYIDSVTGFDLFLPEDVDKSDFRLTLIYYHGDPGRGDIHLRAFIQDVIPSTLRKLSKVANTTKEIGVELLKALSIEPSEKQIAYFRTIYRSVPYMMARAYGGAYLWNCLEAVMRRQRLDLHRPISNAARRMNSLVARLPKSIYELHDEVIFYLTFLEFINVYHKQLCAGFTLIKDKSLTNERSGAMAMRPWKEMLRVVSEGSVDDITYASPAELGFGCGVLIRQFGRWYWNATKTGKEGKDFLKHRVLTFGSDLSPEVIWKRALAKLFDVAARYSTIHMSTDFMQRVGVTLSEFDRLHEDVRHNRDAFMAAFWSGYALQGYDKPSEHDDETQQGIEEIEKNEERS